jgi:hypothetical protein
MPRGVVVAEAGLARRGVVGRAFVDDDRRLGEHTEAVREAVGSVQLAMGLVVHLERLPVPQRRRAGADVDEDVEDRSALAAQELRQTWLEVHPRTTPRPEREWLSCTHSSWMPSSASTLRRVGLLKEARRVAIHQR